MRRCARAWAAAGAGLLLALGGSDAPAASEVDVARSTIGFVSHQMGVPVTGSFRKFDVQMSFDPAVP